MPLATLVKKQSELEEKEYYANTRKIAALAADKKAVDIKVYDVAGLTVIADAFVVCTATSEPQLKAVFNAVKEGMKEIGVAPLRMEGTFSSGWLLLDYGHIILHIFREQARAFYDLDGMWADAREIPVDLDT
jgi:ribosome-associated protein